MMLIILSAFVALVCRLFYLQIVQGDYYSKLSEDNCIRIQRINAFRGLIFDRNGELLVENRPSFDLAIIPKDAKPISKTVETLSRYLQIPVDEITKTIKKNAVGYGFQPVVIKKDISRDALAVISAHRYNLPGVFIESDARRNYVYENRASHAIGYLGEINAKELEEGKFLFKQRGDDVGRQGVEKTYDQLLSGKPGGRIIQVNASGQMIKTLDIVKPEPAHNIFLTIDNQLQCQAEMMLQDKTGAIVAMDPSSGEVLAMASSPGFNQNLFIGGIPHKEWNELISNPDHPLTNKAITGEYPPASTYKIVTAMAGLEEKVIDIDTTTFCPGGYKFGNRVYRCWQERGHGTISVIQALAESCDVFFYNVGRRLGVDRLAWYAKKCGLGAPTGIDLDMESKGLIPTSDWKKKRIGISWQAGENLSIAIGQGYDLVTPLQMATLISAVGNGGTLLKPQILKSVVASDGNITHTITPEARGKLPTSRETLSIIRQGLWEVVNKDYGTARGNVRDVKYDISGKTGTAEVVSSSSETERSPSKRSKEARTHAWFVGYAPSNTPKIAVAIILEHGGHGASAAGPVAKQMILSYLEKYKE